MGDRIIKSGQEGILEEIVDHLGDVAVKTRDENRRHVGNIFSKKSDDALMVVGPCSLDAESTIW
jgi:3-deoxy-D-arabino-heptulosonate 7-phosphate (DAHP) synthase